MKKILGILLSLMIIFTSVWNVPAMIESHTFFGYEAFDVTIGTNNYEPKSPDYCLSYNATATGYTTFTFDGNPGRMYVKDINNKVISNEYDSILPTKKGSKYVFDLGLKKGTTYVLYMIEDTHESPEQYTLTIKNTAIKSSNISKKKAAKVKMKKLVTGIIPLGSNNSAWFKFKYKKTKKCIIKLDTTTMMGEYHVEIFKGKKMVGTTIIGPTKMNWNPFNKVSSDYKLLLKKGTYYVKFSKYNNFSSGKFTMKIK